MQRKYVWLACLLVLFAVLYWLVTVEKEFLKTDIIPDQDVSVPSVFSDYVPTLEDWHFEEIDAFFVEYRLQRDRVRGQEMEVLTEFINNPNTSAEGKATAEKQLLELVATMEKELLVENLVKAQGYSDAIFFYNKEKAHLVLKAADLTESQFVRLSEIVSVLAGINMENVVIIENLEK